MAEIRKYKLEEERPYFRPFQHEWAYDLWLRSEQMHWLALEVPLNEDLKDWKNELSNEEKFFLTNIFRFFTQSDIDVAGGYINNYLPNFPHPEIRMMLSSFAAREAIHISAYSHLIETLGMPDSTYSEFYEYDAMREKHEYFLSLDDDESILPVKMAAISAFTEGVALFSSFVMLLNFPRFGRMKGMGQIIQWSIADETLHCEGIIKLFRAYIEENRHLWTDETKSKIYSIAEKMVDLEDKFIDLAFKMGQPKGLDKDEVKTYIRYIADRRLISMGLKGIFKQKKNPLPWVSDMVNAPGHSNFFEQRSTDYAKGTLSGSWDNVWGAASK